VAHHWSPTGGHPCLSDSWLTRKRDKRYEAYWKCQQPHGCSAFGAQQNHWNRFMSWEPRSVPTSRQFRQFRLEVWVRQHMVENGNLSKYDRYN
jgi:hypothetical protein